MSESATTTAHPFVWYELMTTDAPAAEAYYRDVFGWLPRDAGMPGWRYTLLSVGETPIGGLMALPDEARARGARPGWMGYVGVDDVDADLARVQQAGGTLHHGPEDIPNVGRFAVVGDPQGAVLVLFRSAADQPPPPAVPGTPGRIGWHELHAGDGTTAFGFYASLFGWTLGESTDMGPLGVYQHFAIGGVPAGGVMTKMDPQARPGWLFYVNVDDVDAVAGRVTAGGGRVLRGPEQVPGGLWIVQCLDPQGAVFAFVGPRR